MKTTLCTLYNSLYLDKGLVLYDSLKECAKDFRLYVLCMDEKCYEVLNDINESNMIPIRLEDFEDDELLKVKPTRSFGEYCWTCTPSIIKYVIEKYNEPICTYIDADMYFYQDPQILVDEMLSMDKSVMIVPHRFTWVNKDLERNGIYCVEFNTFMNKEDSLEVLRQWRNDCLECCTSENDGVHFGDQKYLDEWPEKYNCVYICPHLGAGVAPWNIQSYKLVSSDGNDIKLKSRTNGTVLNLVFYHFQYITYIDDNDVHINVFLNKLFINKELVVKLYKNYLNKIREKKMFVLSKYSIVYTLKSHPALSHRKRSFVDIIQGLTLKGIIDKLIIIYNKKNDTLSF